MIALKLDLLLSQAQTRICQIPSVSGHACGYHMQEITGTLLHIYTSHFFFTRSSGVDEGDLPHCLETGIGNLTTKAITEPKSREILFGTTL